jgi:hypothetical protein
MSDRDLEKRTLKDFLPDDEKVDLRRFEHRFITLSSEAQVAFRTNKLSETVENAFRLGDEEKPF